MSTPVPPAQTSGSGAEDRSAPFEAFRDLAARFPDEVVTRAEVSDVALPGQAGTLALVRLDNHAGPRRPTTLGPNTLIGLGEVLTDQAERARAGEIAAVAVTGKPGFLVAGADLGSIKELTEPADGARLARLGHEVYDLLTEFPAPSFAFINGLALGGGLELALAAQYRTVSSGARGLGLPEAFIGLVPGWGGVWKTPRITGPRDARPKFQLQVLDDNKKVIQTGSDRFGVVWLPPGKYQVQVKAGDWDAWENAGEVATVEAGKIIDVALKAMPEPKKR